jgi:hypothetical protein
VTRFISNLTGKVDAFTPILRLKDNADFTSWQNISMLLILSKIIYLRF